MAFNSKCVGCTLLFLMLLTLPFLACSKRVQYGDPTATETLTIDFGSTDLQLIAEKMVGSLLASPVVQEVHQPVILVSHVRNKTDEHFPLLIYEEQEFDDFTLTTHFKLVDGQVEEVGGVVPGIEAGWFQRGIADSSFRQQREVESGMRKIVGVNDFTDGSDTVEIDTLKISQEVEKKQRSSMARLREERDAHRVRESLAALEEASGTDANLVEPILDCARAYCTLFEIREAMEKVFGSYKEPVFF